MVLVLFYSYFKLVFWVNETWGEIWVSRSFKSTKYILVLGLWNYDCAFLKDEDITEDFSGGRFVLSSSDLSAGGRRRFGLNSVYVSLVRNDILNYSPTQTFHPPSYSSHSHLLLTGCICPAAETRNTSSLLHPGCAVQMRLVLSLSAIQLLLAITTTRSWSRPKPPFPFCSEALPWPCLHDQFWKL